MRMFPNYDMEISFIVQETMAQMALSYRAESPTGGSRSGEEEKLDRVETLTKGTNSGEEDKKNIPNQAYTTN